jgi:cytochrome P450
MNDGRSALPPAGRVPRPKPLAQLGYIRRLFRAPHRSLDDLAAEFGPICQLGAGPFRLVILGDPAMLQQMFAMNVDDFRWNHRFNAVGVKFVVGPGSMIVSDGDDHRRRRTSVQGAFTRQRLNEWIPMILERTDAAIERALDAAGRAEISIDQASVPIDLGPIVSDLILGVTVRAFFGERLATRAAEIGALEGQLQEFIEAPAVRQLPHPFPFTARARVRAARRQLDRIVDDEIAERRARPSGDQHDVLEALVADGTLSDAEMRDQVMTLIGAGFDTTSAVLMWAMWCATLLPGAWQRLRDEADAVFGSVTGEVGPLELAQLEYAGRAIHETLRLHPAGAVGARQTAKPIRLGDVEVPAGTLLIWSPHLAGRDASTWDDPLRFDPDRFLDPTPDHKAAQQRAWIPFGRGAHGCIGFALAQMELTLMLARIAQRLDLQPTSAETPQPVGMVVNRPLGGAPFVVSARSV